MRMFSGLRPLRLAVPVMAIPVLAIPVLAVSSGSAFAQAGAGGAPGGAPSSLCPPGFNLSNGLCTNGTTGAFSGAALASQALSDLSESSTQQTNQASEDGIANRRDQERRRRDEVRPVVRTVAAPAILPKRTPGGKVRTAAKRRRVPAGLPVPAPMVPYQEPAFLVSAAPRYGSWAQGFGDYERRSGRGSTVLGSFPTVGAAGVGGLPNPTALAIDSRTRTAGFVGGLDLTIRSAIAPNDGLIFGVLAGYIDTTLALDSTSTSGGVIAGNGVGNGNGHLSADLSGGSVGAYATYFNGGFSTDATLKVDVLHLSETFNDNLAFSTANNGAAAAALAGTSVSFNGTGSANLTNTSLMGNINYRYALAPTYWIEPTAGVVYTITTTGSGAQQLGLADGYLFRVQAGARLGTDRLISERVLMTASVTGLAFDDARISGGFVPGLAGNDILARSDQGHIRGQGIFDVNFNYGNGISTFLQGNVRGGDNLFGAGGKGGIRYVW